MPVSACPGPSRTRAAPHEATLQAASPCRKNPSALCAESGDPVSLNEKRVDRVGSLRLRIDTGGPEDLSFTAGATHQRLA